MEELYLSENELLRLPASLGNMVVLKTLYAQNNRLETICPELGKCLSLEVANFTNNPNIDNLPSQVLKDAPVILWLCRHNYKYKELVDELSETNESLEAAAEFTEDEKHKMREEIEGLKAENVLLLKDRPERLIKMYNKSVQLKSAICVLQ
jgi:Leucine-rich repeat (LRR) protein